METPDCDKWNIWYGQEIEGQSELGVKTLFVRKGNFDKYLDQYDRVWFTKEYDNFSSILKTIELGKTVCIEITLDSVNKYPEEIKSNAQLYLKIEAPYLKDGDHVCVGTRFKDEGFMLGNGTKVTPSMYNADVRLE